MTPNFVLMSSASSGTDVLSEGDFMDVRLSPGMYLVEYTNLEAQYVGVFHRFTRREIVAIGA